MTADLRLDEAEIRRAGECASCAHADIVRSSQGSTFYRCRLSDADPGFRRYPVLPMHGCPGYTGTASV